MSKTVIFEEVLSDWGDKPWLIPREDGTSLMQRQLSVSSPGKNAPSPNSRASDAASSSSVVWSDWFVGLHTVFRQILPEVPCREDVTFSVSTWFLDHSTRRKCAMPKIVQLNDLPDDWYEDLLFPWRYHIDDKLPVFLSVVAPKQPTAAFETHVADVLLTQNPQDMSSVLFTLKLKDSLGPDMILRIAVALQGDVTKSDEPEPNSCNPEEHPMTEGQDEAQQMDTPGETGDVDAFSHIQTVLRAGTPKQAKDSPWDHQNAFLQDAIQQNNIPDPGTDSDSPDQSEGSDGTRGPFLEEDSPDESVGASATGYQNVWLYHMQDPVQLAVISWAAYDDMLRDVSTVLRIPLDDMHSLYPMTHKPSDVPREIEPLLVRLEDDLPDDGTQVLCLVDLEIHAHPSEPNFATMPTLRRCAMPLPRQANRFQILYHLAVDDYCSIEEERCLVHHQGNLWPLQHDESRTLANGDYVKVVIPPSQCRHEATTLLLAQHQQDAIQMERDFQILEEMQADLSDSEIFHALQVSAELTNGHAELHVESQCQKNTPEGVSSCNIPDDLPRVKVPNDPYVATFSFTDEFLRAVRAFTQAADDQPDFGPLPAELGVQSAFVQELFPLWQDAARPGPGNVEMLARVETWFLDHVSMQRSQHTRIGILSPDYTQWENDLVRLWNDFRIPGADLQFAFVDPTPADCAANVLGQIMLIQRADPRQTSIVVTLSDSHVAHGQPRSIALVMPQRIMLPSVLSSLSLENICPPEARYNVCRMFFGEAEILPDQILRLSHGMGPHIRVTHQENMPVQSFMSNSLITEGFFPPTVPEFANLHGAYPPDWFSILQEHFRRHAVPDQPGESPSAEILVWYLNGVSQLVCEQSRIARITSSQAQWYFEITAPWHDTILPGRPIRLYTVEPNIPRQAWQTHIAHVIIVQQPVEDHAAVVVSEKLDSRAVVFPRQVAYFCLVRVALPELIQSLPVVFAQTKSVQEIQRGNMRIPSTVTTWLGDGDGFIVHFAQDQTDAHDSFSMLQQALKVNVADKPRESDTSQPSRCESLDGCLPSVSIEDVYVVDQLKSASRSVPAHVPKFGCQDEAVSHRTSCKVSNKVTISLEATIPPKSPVLPISPDWAEIPVSTQQNWIAKIEETACELVYLPEGIQLHTDTAHALAHPEAYCQPELAGKVELYIDGSTAPGVAAWSLVVIKYDHLGIPHFCGCCAAPVEVGREGKNWLGADWADNISAEFSAVAIAQTMALAIKPTSSFIIRPDLQLSVLLSADQCKCKVHPCLSQLVQWLGAAFLQHGGHFQEVRSHQGQPWNELADRVAHFSALHHLEIGKFCLTACNELVSTNSIAWAWTQLKNTAFLSCLPPTEDGVTWKIQPSGRKVTMPPEQDSGTVDYAWFSIKVVSANVLAINSHDNSMITAGERVLRLSRQWNAQCCHVIGIQESRRPPGRQINDHYITIASGADTTHPTPMFGCELWFHRKLPWLKRDNGQDLTIEDAKITVAHADPRRLIVNVSLAAMSFSFVALHVPCKHNASDSLQQLQAWWEETKKLLRHSCLSPYCWVCIDANAPLATAESPEVGMYGAESMNEAGHLFEDSCHELHWHVPSTFDWCHVGQHHTWTHPKGTKHRRDYVVTSMHAFPLTHQTVVQAQHDGGFAHEDHLPVELLAQGWIPVANSSPKLKWDHDAFRDPTRRAAFRAALESLPVPTWDVNIDVHTKIFESQVLQLAQQFFAPQGKAKAKPRLSETTLNLIAWKRSVLDFGRKNDLMQCPTFRSELRQIEMQIRRAVRTDQSTFYAKLIDDLEEAGDLSNFKVVYGTLRRLGCRKSTNPGHSRALPFLKDSSGNVVATFAQQQMLWMSQFGKLEAGQPMSWDSLRSMHGSGLGIDPVVLNPDVIPTAADFLSSIAKLKAGKAAGPNMIPPEVCKIGSSVFAHHLAPIVLKAACHGKEPLSWRGGKLVALHKGKLPAWDPNGYRSIFVSDHTAKLYHSALRRHLVQTWERNLTHLQVGGRVGLGTDFAHHAVQAHWAHATIQKKPAAIIFYDFQAAFYSVIRQGLFQEELDPQGLRSAMYRLGAKESEIDELLSYAHQDAALNGIDPHAALLLQDLFRSTYFTVEGVKHPCMTSKGTRPGDPVGDVLFNMSMRLILKDVTEFISQRTSASWEGTPAQHHDFTLFSEPPTLAWWEIAFVDDCAISIRAENNNELLELVKIATAAMVTSARKRGLVVNFDTGKSEVMLNLVGAGTRQLKESLAANNFQIDIEVESDRYRLRSVFAYRHLGTWFQQSGKQQRDARYRLSLAKQSWGPLVKPFFSKPQISIATKIQVFSSLIMARYCYNVHTWAMPTEGVLQEWNNALRPLLYPLVRRFLRGLPPFRFGIETLCGLLNMLSPVDQLHLNRLRYLQRLLKTCTQSLWNMLLSVRDDERPWVAQCCQSLKWFAKFYGPKFGLTDRSNFHDWIAAVRIDRAWKGRLRRAAQSCIQYRLAEAEAAVWQCYVQQELLQHGGIEVPPVEDAIVQRWKCDLCDAEFASKHALATHCTKAHGYRKLAKHYARDGRCAHCTRDFHTRTRLCAHFHGKPECLQHHQECFVPLTPDELQALDAQDREHHRELRQQGWLSTKATVPAVRSIGPPLPPLGSTEAKQMRAFWQQRSESVEGHAFQQFAGHLVGEQGSVTMKDAQCNAIPGFLYQSPQGTIKGHAGRFEMSGLARMAAILHIRTYCFVHFYSGYRRTGDLQFHIDNHVIQGCLQVFCLSVDFCIQREGGDLSTPASREWWKDRIYSGSIAGVGGGPPCESFSAARHLPDGPCPLRSEEFINGLPHNNQRGWSQTLLGSRLMRFLIEMLIVCAQVGACGFLEHPAYPLWIQALAPASIWLTQELKWLRKLHCCSVLTIDQCVLGCGGRKPTTLFLVRLPGLIHRLRRYGEQGRCNHPPGFHPGLSGKDTSGVFRTSVAKIYPSLLNQELAAEIVQFISTLESCPSFSSPLPEEFLPFRCLDFVAHSIVQRDFHAEAVPIFKPKMERASFAYWPGGGGLLDSEYKASEGYFIVGSWSNWREPEEMVKQKDGSYSTVVTLGASRKEAFHILLDGEPDKVLHPERPDAVSGTRLHGPTNRYLIHGQQLNWVIDGRQVNVAVDDAVKAIVPHVSAQMQLRTSRDALAHVRDWGEEGDRYEVKLFISGRYRAVTWSKI
eukprot:s1133_g2.t1